LGKRLEVYLTNEEVEKLNGLCDVSGENQSRIIKTALNHLAKTKNGHNGHNPSEPTVEIPTNVRLRAMVKESIRELKEENKRKADADAKAKKESKSSDRLLDSMMKLGGFSD